MNLIFRQCLLCFSIIASSNALAHGAEQAGRALTSVSGSTSSTYRNKSTVEKGEPRLIRGVLLGGESLATEEGATLDDIKMQSVWAGSKHYTVHSGLMAHQSSGEVELELESFWVNLDSPDVPWGLQFAMGKMVTETTQSASWHASQSTFSEASLLSDVFWGRHFSDTGVRLSKRFQDFKVGLEVWNGNSWPASVGEGSIDGFIHFTQSWRVFSVNSGAWVMSSKAESRTDIRYGAGHSHGGVTINNPTSDYAFTGDIQSGGAFVAVSLPIGHFLIDNKFEAISQSYDGELRNTNQNSVFKADYQGMRFEISAALDRHKLSASYETLNLENRFYGNITELFVSNAGLLNNGFEPAKTSISWSFQWKPELAFRTEWVADGSVSEDTVSRFSVGFRWEQSWRF